MDTEYITPAYKTIDAADCDGYCLMDDILCYLELGE